MSKRCILRPLLVFVLPVLLVIGLYYGLMGVVTLVENNKELKDKNISLQHKVSVYSKELEHNRTTINSMQSTIDDMNDRMSTYEKQISALLDENAELKEKSKQVSRGKVNGNRTITMRATAYTAYCEGCSGLTTWNEINLRDNPDIKVIAVDPSIIPLGTKVYVEGYGYAIAADKGGLIKGYKIDVFIPNKGDALKWGNRSVKVTILNDK